MLAYGVSSVVGSFFQCIPTGSAVARSIILKDVGGQTQVSGLVSSAVVAVTLYAFAPLFEPLPKCILGVVIIVALVPMLLKVKNLPKLWKTSRSDAALWLLSCVSVIFLDVTYGLIVGSLLGLLIIFLKLNSHKGVYLQAYSNDIFLPSGSHISWADDQTRDSARQKILRTMGEEETGNGGPVDSLEGGKEGGEGKGDSANWSSAFKTSQEA
ncbi:sulfate transporter isoform X3 [Ixodes scapularis]